MIIFVFTQWGKWFNNPVEPPFTTASHPHHIALTVQDNTCQRVITWQCDTVVQEAWVELHDYQATDSTVATTTVRANHEVHRSEGGVSVFYRANMPLSKSGKYAYRVCHPNVQSQWHDYTIHPHDGRMQFLYLGDIQDTIGGATHLITQRMIEKHPDIDFVLLGGDIIHRPHEHHWDEFFSGAAPYIASYPTLATTGNHEYLKGINGICERRFPLHFPYFLHEYNENSYCYAKVKCDNTELFLLDSNRNIMDLWEQRNKLKSDLKASQARWKVVVLHHPPYSIKGDSNNIHLRWLLSSVIADSGVSLVLCAHEHGYARIHPHDGTTPAYIISHCSPKKYTHDNTDIAQKYLNDDRYYQHIVVEDVAMRVTTYNSEGMAVDSLEITR